MRRTGPRAERQTFYLNPLSLAMSVTGRQTGDFHFAEGGCVCSTSRSTWRHGTALSCADVPRLVETTQPRS
jgi:hypothetical protein